MAKKKIDPKDNESNMQNSNPDTSKGTQGINEQYKAVLDNKSKQKNPEYQKAHPPKSKK